VLSTPGGAFEAVPGTEFGPAENSDGRRDHRPARVAARSPRSGTRARLNALVHPPVIRREKLNSIAESSAQAPPEGIAVVEAAILIRNGSYSRFDIKLISYCTEQQQVERGPLRREGDAGEGLRARISGQIAARRKRKYADFVIDTSGEKEGHLAADPGRRRALRRSVMRVLRTGFGCLAAPDLLYHRWKNSRGSGSEGCGRCVRGRLWTEPTRAESDGFSND